MTDDTNAEFSREIAEQRAHAHGVLEGRVISLETRMDRHETWIAKRLEAFETKLDVAMAAITAMVASQGVGHRWQAWLIPALVATAMTVLGQHFFAGIALSTH